MQEFYDKESGEWKKLFTPEEMGNVWPDTKFITINKEFADKHLFENISPWESYFNNYWSQEIKGVDTKIICPFCKKGSVILVKKKKDICETHVCHVGDEFSFRCSEFKEEGCHGSFFYFTRWMYC